jgi:uncharacterized membrane protein YgcG
MQIASQRTLEYGQVVLSTDNIFTRCRANSHIVQPPQTHPLQQLEVIGNYVSDLVAICSCRRGSGSSSTPAAAGAAAGGGGGAGSAGGTGALAAAAAPATKAAGGGAGAG